MVVIVVKFGGYGGDKCRVVGYGGDKCRGVGYGGNCRGGDGNKCRGGGDITILSIISIGMQT